MALNLIYARARNGVIGKDNQMPWHLPEDLAHFKRVTMGQPVIMGRKTWESIPAKFRPLPGRENIVLTRQTQWSAHGAQVASSLQQALQICASHEQVWVMGGAEIYAQALPLASKIVVTEIDAEFEGDAYAPVLHSSWKEIDRVENVSENGLAYAFVTLFKS
ncbi:MAG: dihydrofolate reductase [Betaproteobacteria bacterium]|jgi:dihydrofolate reductase|nr:dihydrofolate reductase [Betaproteobacteria bacterium]NBT66414.1 dihydrofolate reductase [Betaproteobacteria bacterium]NBY06606.1 dihydrofolate reductase [Betaproteobacteria bacterium]